MIPISAHHCCFLCSAHIRLFVLKSVCIVHVWYRSNETIFDLFLRTQPRPRSRGHMYQFLRSAGQLHVFQLVVQLILKYGESTKPAKQGLWQGRSISEAQEKPRWGKSECCKKKESLGESWNLCIKPAFYRIAFSIIPSPPVLLRRPVWR